MPLLSRLKYSSAGLIALSCFLIGAALAHAQDSRRNLNPSYIISRIKIEQTADEYQLVIQGQSAPTYTMYELFDPLRVVLDVADSALSGLDALPESLPQGPVQDIKHTALTDQDPPIVRLEIQLTDDKAYTVERQDTNIVVRFAKNMNTRQEQKSSTPGAATSAASVISDLEIETGNPAETLVFIKTDGMIQNFQKAHLAKGGGRPDRMYIDIPNLTLPHKTLQLNVGTSLAKVRAAQRKNSVRIVFDSALPELFAYNIENTGNGLLVKISEENSSATPILASLVTQNKQIGTREQSSSETSKQPSGELIVPKFSMTKPAKKQPLKKEASAPAKEPAAKKSTQKGTDSSFAFSGYEKQKITVDFFKIDLHNVFRLFGEISGQNIVVDEGVKGTLTLALNEVPWDFALDIILNLQDLQKEERYNTIVISPKAKAFQWPKDAADQIAFKSDGSMGKVEAISVTQRLETPKEVVEAKTLIQQATLADKNGQYDKALPLYESAFAKWPDNAPLANRIASLCLTQLGMNAKAVHYAKAALNLEPDNADAALQAAIGSANMKKVTEAKEYFDLSVSGPNPPSHALLSYAAFAEEYQSYSGALKLLAKNVELYGETLDTLVGKARILDKSGQPAQAVVAYNAVLLSGYEVPEDLRRFIEGRIAAAN